jgi:hypothetical protein
MRDIIDKLELINESTGLAGRRTGDVFRNEAGDEITFDNIMFVPEQGGRLEDKDLDDAIVSVDDAVQWLNNRTSRTGGYAIATFNGSDGFSAQGGPASGWQYDIKIIIGLRFWVELLLLGFCW